jgi:photosystem II stability/assembly factor-like uncharacterized protein
MKYARLLVLYALSVSLLFSCKKDGNDGPPPEERKKIVINSISPESAFCGDTVTVTGQNFATDTSKIKLYLGSDRMPLISASDVKLTFVIPRDYIKMGKRSVQVFINEEGKEPGFKSFLVSWLEPHGWYYASNIPANSGDTFPSAGRIAFVNDTIGFIQREKYVFRSEDGGLTWNNITPGNAKSNGVAFSSFDGTNIWINTLGYVNTTSNRGESWLMSKATFTWNIIGLHISSPANGLVVTEGGQVFKVNGSFETANVTLDYTSKYNSIPNIYGHRWNQFSALDESNLMITGRTLMSDNKYQLTISHKTGADFNEYNIGYATTATYAKFVQLIAKNSAYLIDGNNDILKFNGALNWVKLTQKATALCFIDANTGYAAYDGKIVKTTDGGTTWKDDLSLKAGERIFSLVAKNGKVWAAGIDATQQCIILRFNP